MTHQNKIPLFRAAVILTEMLPEGFPALIDIKRNRGTEEEWSIAISNISGPVFQKSELELIVKTAISIGLLNVLGEPINIDSILDDRYSDIRLLCNQQFKRKRVWSLEVKVREAEQAVVHKAEALCNLLARWPWSDRDKVFEEWFDLDESLCRLHTTQMAWLKQSLTKEEDES